MYKWNWTFILDNWPALLYGSTVSVVLTVVVVLIGTVIGGAFGVLLKTTDRLLAPIRLIVQAFIEILRALPVLVLLLYLHYVVPDACSWLHAIFKWGIDQVRTNVPIIPSALLDALSSRAFASATMGLSFNLAAFVAPLVQSGIDGVPRHSIEAGLALGMKRSVLIRRIILPDVIRSQFQGLLALYITMFKFTTIAGYIALPELLHQVFVIGNETYRYLELYTAMAIIYLLILWSVAYCSKRIERHRWLRRRP